MKTYFHHALKNTDLQSDASGSVSATRLYDAWGNVVSSTGSWKSPFGNAGRFGYQEDPDSGLKLLGHRYYDSSTGHFLTRDPAKDGRNWYGYCRNSPVSSVDPTGLDDEGMWFMYGLMMRISQMPPWLQAAVLKLLGYTVEEMNMILAEGEAVMAGEEIAASRGIEIAHTVLTNTSQRVYQLSSSFSRSGKFPQAGPGGGFVYRVEDGKVQSMALYNPSSQLMWRLDLWSRSGRVDHSFPHFHSPGVPGVTPGLPPTMFKGTLPPRKYGDPVPALAR